MTDHRDAWLDDVRSWFYGGTPPHDPQPAFESHPESVLPEPPTPTAVAARLCRNAAA